MIKTIFVLLLVFLSLNAKDNIDAKIDKTSKKIKNFSKTYSSINRKMANNAKKILRQEREIYNQQKYLKKLKEELSLKEQSYQNDTIELLKLKKEQKFLQKSQTEIEHELVFTIAKSVSLSVILEENEASGENALIEIEVLKSMLKKTKAKAKELNEQFYENSKIIAAKKEHVDRLENEIGKIDKKQKQLLQAQTKNKKSLIALQRSEKEYKKELKSLLKKQDTLKQTLSELKIVKLDAIKKAKEDERRRRAFAAKKDQKDLPKVKKPGSSYQKVKTIKYTGPKTITPIYPYTITKKYGTYTDPIYGIKIFNESISMMPKSKNTKVKTVFNGKVIYADKTAVLDNIVIVEHKNGLHTIYANLSQISPNIKKGKKIKKGYTIGRVNDELIFEVTQKSYHINPIRLFE
ncbi:peptidoglycan DD-metalloendopeptidase family protein [Sulfurimonas lithotrophica]|uniref:Peptidoglycan DD-metalloendopeptidase family protein n=1 Tax=Sulfurimonas lithotrophica TaxID=2590022 RepID=A0A5P8P1L9_9BACT|nr:peptidoglycan DD-metalloendopeptidase family protein [Sulfurimonas lithotrophica]QFR49622.1 peptidoglycan DD-metalloendopeptidase family protein [Sulfurimonas lithotrophica]